MAAGLFHLTKRPSQSLSFTLTSVGCMSELALDSIRNRVRGLHSLWLEAAETMDSEHVNYFERPGVLPIAFTVHHAINIEDASVNFLMRGLTPIWHRDGWAERTEVHINNHGKELTVAEMELQRIGNWNEYRNYMRSVFDETDSWLETLKPPDLETVMFNGEFPEMFRNAYIARVVTDQIRIIDAIECWVFQHGSRHMGELEHARALVGLGGMTS